VYAQIAGQLVEYEPQDAVIAAGNQLVAGMLTLGVPEKVAFEINQAALIAIGEHLEGGGPELVPSPEALGEAVEIGGDVIDDDDDDRDDDIDGEPIGAATAGELVGDEGPDEGDDEGEGDEQPDEGDSVPQGDDEEVSETAKRMEEALRGAKPEDDDEDMEAAQARFMATMRAGGGDE
jgi:hypothetical protein